MDTATRLSDITKSQARELQSLDFTKWLSCLAAQRGAKHEAAQLFLQKFPDSLSAVTMRKALDSNQLLTKAAIAPGTTQEATWAKPLVGLQSITSGFLAIAHSQSLLGRLGLELIPPNVKVPYQTAEANYTWMPENFVAPVSKLAFSDGLTLPATKIVGIVVLTMDLVVLAGAGAVRAMRNALAGGLNAFVDKQLLDPTVAAVAGKNPASILNGLTPIVGTADIAATTKALINAFFAASPGATAPVLIANGGNAATIRGQQPGFGLEVFASEAAGKNIIILDPQRTFYSDGGLDVDYSEYASLQMDSAPLDPVTAAAVSVSLWQQNLAGFRVTRFVSWGAAPNAVAYATTP